MAVMWCNLTVAETCSIHSFSEQDGMAFKIREGHGANAARRAAQTRRGQSQ
jgi:hypothetical protein